ncbi:DUF3388 domain-containing protein [Staphylococcus aureus]
MYTLLIVQLLPENLNPKHQELVNEVMTLPSIKVVEHPDLFVETSTCTMEDFDYIIELREMKIKKYITRSKETDSPK